ncbi:YY1-associated factor 2 [Harpegnathos saltator]|uniref:RING1 and YY1-binding protein B n=1 Tax=Harpegnathos saltator TaxID=610380 RepID=E2BA53_HARSA|nr:YY1-associated factor 2 [Harpegnathos saltator]XP_011134987.1 YY1-associated factor 2 [Harpegnathos saltator]XP_011134988.1 YY1-associated factor 2 [Harpegnathos saltator]XP_011134989.1 YY1-associated factor 2 [Harpegnathos saltator]XP_011134990.1 YY1-associated factor 2 [Harpegnathos saltator]XP_011134991.1 YY1-associated factor 2 [Harpegnathos saltator]XP_025158177.1 YY1-associated factor 2 [Harpegnathos saltator]XP_032673819.1 YY1-associated factor 2 [Odontomachus brunneus]XP_03267382
MNHSGSGKRQAKVLEDNFWDCSVCTYRNTAEAFKCLMCDVRKGTSTRKPRINPQLVAQQVAQQQYVPLLKPGKKEGSSGGSTTSGGKEKERKLDKPRRKNRHPPRLKNIDRSTAQSNEVTVNNVTVVITEYKPKVKKGSDQSGVSSSASSENGSQHDSNQDSRSLDIGTDA